MKTSYSFILIFLLTTNLQAQWSTDPDNNLIVGYGLDPHICSDSVGGCYVTYDYNSTSYPRWLAVERLDKYGYKPWGINKRILGELPEQWQAEIVEDGEGGVIVSYQDNEWIPPTYFNSKVRVQKVDSSGNFLWGQTGVQVSLETVNHSGQHLVSDGDGGCIIIWGDWDGPVRMNRINRLGQRVWGETGIQLASNHTNLSIVKTNDDKYYVQVDTIVFRIDQNGEIINQYSTLLWNMIPDPEGGIVLSGTMGNITNLRLVSQRKDSLGNNLWQEPYVEIADSLGLGSFRIGINKRIINYAWLGTYNGQSDRPFFQAVNMDGNLVYQNNILLSEDPSGTTLIGIISSYYNNTIFSWSVSGEINSIFAQMYDTLGNKIWIENGVIVAHPRLTNQQYKTDGRGGLIVVGTINEFTIVAQQVSLNGKLGEIVTSILQDYEEVLPLEILLYQNYPNPFNSHTVINYEIRTENKVKISLYNILGERLRILSDEHKSIGTHSLIFNSDDLPSGVYVYTLEINSQVLTKKLIIIK